MLTAIALTFFATALVGVPIAFSLGLSSAVAVLVSSDLPLRMIPERMVAAVDSFPLLAIPLFMLAGELMESAGILSRLVEFARVLVGHIRGGLAHVCVICEMILSGVTGTAVGDAAALASVFLGPMRQEYDEEFGAGVVAAAANIGPIIPPSAAMIVYAIMAGSSVSIAGLFLAGLVPGILIAIGMMVLAWAIARRRGYPVSGARPRARDVAVRTWKALPVLLMPVVVIGGMVAGVFTATEAAAVAVVYALAVGFLVTRELRPAHLWPALVRSGTTTSIVVVLIALASGVTFLLTVAQVPAAVAAFLTSVTTSPTVFLTLVMLFLLVVGMFLESNAAYIMLVPILHPIAVQYGIDPLHFGFVFVLNLVIGMLTPPVGVVLFVVASLSGLTMERLVRGVWPFVLLQFAVLFLCVYFPSLYMWVPRLFGY
ncbi:MAG: TRAP transporter large permease [Candidatus Rokubacteria bacterium]|nr:TRAP transporter large permease [Candidatus Rokubacteria bacterium]MBI2493657.1 TRAP transporter large permease [Candidatus Rokubacteria bacterium]